MWSLICLQLLVAAAGQVHGVELRLSAVNLMRTDDSLPCGTVRCVDEVDQSSGNSIKSLQIRKQLNREVLVNLNQEDNSFNCKFDGITANGNWTSYKAEAGLTLYNSQDCNDAKFICESVHVSKLGVEHVSSSSGQINYKLGSQVQDLASSVADFENKVNTLTKSDSKIQELSSSVANLQSKLEHLTKSDSKIQELSSSVADLQSKVEQLTKSDSKIQELSSSVNKILNKLDALTDKTNEVKTQQPLTTCPRSTSASPDNRYQVVYPTDGTPFSYLCDTDGGWTVIQRRTNGKTNFYRNWSSYKYGFGSFFEDFWLGLERIHQITSPSNYELNITMKFKGKVYYAHYDNFKVSGEENNYRLSIGAYTGNAGDSLRYQNNMMFTTFDKDNDKRDDSNCAKRYNGAGWYKGCYMSNLNGNWRGKGLTRPMWFDLSESEPVTMSELKIRKML